MPEITAQALEEVCTFLRTEFVWSCTKGFNEFEFLMSHNFLNIFTQTFVMGFMFQSSNFLHKNGFTITKEEESFKS